MSKPPQSKPPKQKQPKEPALEHSEFAGEFEDEGITVLVDIFRPAGTNGDWTLEVISQTEVVTTWDENFATDKDAWEEFLATAERDGLESFLDEEEEPSVH
ncbi:hypothetical protein N7E02_25830 [Aliirhizobium terrae]|uniref:hypothetical protein n=1 Tax=Terrirhizobium terrae TaxID=2926709 RepID=UPI002575C9BB|nr:hypothetical protein [Rhizobium sp. CC-CFT758]WJH40041.1 hypothetical protein N7E02_25830 [Rhizobium sp. CC-CFT758]